MSEILAWLLELDMDFDPREGHPTPDVIVVYVEGCLPREIPRDEVEGHLRRCECCQNVYNVVEAMSTQRVFGGNFSA